MDDYPLESIPPPSSYASQLLDSFVETANNPGNNGKPATSEARLTRERLLELFSTAADGRVEPTRTSIFTQ